MDDTARKASLSLALSSHFIAAAAFSSLLLAAPRLRTPALAFDPDYIRE